MKDEFKDKGLSQAIKMFAKNGRAVEVGILGDKAARSREDGESTNAEIGAKHEYGHEGMPVRSFLRMPLNMKLKERLAKDFPSNTLPKEILQDTIPQADLTKVMKKIGVMCEAIIQEAFDTGGYGQWKPSRMELKTNHQTLVETGQLRGAITSRVVKK